MDWLGCNDHRDCVPHFDDNQRCYTISYYSILPDIEIRRAFKFAIYKFCCQKKLHDRSWLIEFLNVQHC